MDKKTCAINELEIKKEDGKIYLTGYANNKNISDSYGDIPTNLNGKKVYDLTRMKKNPVMLVDHQNSASAVMGNFVTLREDDKGLFFKALLRNPEDLAQPSLKDVINGYQTGFIRSLSIGGRWLFEDPKNPNHLTKAIIHEISGVAVGADGLALTSTEKPKVFTNNETAESQKLEAIKKLVKEYMASKDNDNLNKIKEILK